MNIEGAPTPSKSFPSAFAFALVLIVMCSIYKESKVFITNTSMKTENSRVVENTVMDKRPVPWDYDTVGSSLSRAFPTWPSNDPAGWCVFEHEPVRKRNKATTGLIYVKTPKTGSSTVAGIVTRIAIAQGNRTANNGTACGYRNHHNAPGPAYGERDRKRSFMWTSVRHPSKRAISRVFFTYVTQRNWSTNDESVLRAMDSKSWQIGVVSQGAGGHQLNYVTIKGIPVWSAWNETNKTLVLQPERVRENVKDVIQAYDFIMVTERMDESVVALQLLLGVEVGDVLSTSAKVSGGWDVHNKNCVKIKRSFVSPGIKAFLESDEWHAKNYGDFMLYSASNRSLDLTIEWIGRDRFDAALARYRELMDQVRDVCSPKLVLPCSSNGTYQKDLSASHCYQHDEGCGYRCIDELLLNQRTLPAS